MKGETRSARFLTYTLLAYGIDVGNGLLCVRFFGSSKNLESFHTINGMHRRLFQEAVDRRFVKLRGNLLLTRTGFSSALV